MDIEEAIKYFGSAYNLCKRLGVTKQNATHWRNDKHIPYVHQIRIEKLSNGALKAEEWREFKK